MTDLTDLVRQALREAGSEAELAQALAAEPVLSRVLEHATMTDEQVQQALNYAPGTLKAIRRKSSTFPTPAVEERRWRRAEVAAYREAHARAR